MMLMGGLYDQAGHYVIITKPANNSMIAIHDRMPFLLAPGVMKDYLFDEEKAKAYTNKIVGMIRVEGEIL